jgi:hypothetical protein
LNPGFDTRDLRDLLHHPGGNIAPGRLLEIGLKQLEQFALPATHVQVSKFRGCQAPPPEKPSNQIGFAAMEKYRLLPREPISNRVAQ